MNKEKKIQRELELLERKRVQELMEKVARKGHKMPTTRREFLAQGFIDLSTMVIMPGVLGMLARQDAAYAQALNCGAGSGGAGFIPFLCYDMDGGSAIAGNVVAMDAGGNMLTAYDRLGLVSPGAITVDRSLGVPMASNASQILAGIKQTASAAALANFRMAFIAHTGTSDSATNKHNATMQIARAGAVGNLIRSGVGTNNTQSGGNTGVDIFISSLRPLQVSNYNSVATALSYGPALKSLPAQAQKALAKALSSVSGEQAAKVGNMSYGDQLSLLVQCGLLKNADLAGGNATGTDPRLDADAAAIYGLTSATSASSSSTQLASIALNVIMQNSGPGTIAQGDCDYHTGNQTDGDAADLKAGQNIGRAIELAFRKKKPLMISLITDGGISSQAGNRNWDNDDNGKSGTLLGYFNPNGAPTMRRTQLGAYTNGQAADATPFFGANTAMVSAIIYLNYVSAMGRMDLWDQFKPANFPNDAKLDDLIIFG